MAALQAFFNIFSSSPQQKEPLKEPLKEPVTEPLKTAKRKAIDLEEPIEEEPLKDALEKLEPLKDDAELEVLTTPRKVRRSSRKRRKPKKFE